MTWIKAWGLALLLLLPALPLHAEGLKDAYKAFEKGQYEDAAKAFEKHTQKQPQDYDQLYNTGVALFQKGDYAGAGQYFDRARQSADPQLKSRAAYNKGVALGQQQQWEQAEAAFQEALSYDNDNVMIQDNLKFAQEQKKRQQQETAKNDAQQNKESKQGDQQDSKQESNGQQSPNSEQKQAQNQESKQGDQQDSKQESNGQQSPNSEQKQVQNQDADSRDKEQKQAGEPKQNTAGQSEAKDGAMPQEKQEGLAQKNGQKQGQDNNAGVQAGEPQDGDKGEKRVLTLKDLKKQEAEKLLRSVDDRIGTYILTPEQANTEGKSRNGKDW